MSAPTMADVRCAGCDEMIEQQDPMYCAEDWALLERDRDKERIAREQAEAHAARLEDVLREVLDDCHLVSPEHYGRVHGVARAVLLATPADSAAEAHAARLASLMPLGHLEGCGGVEPCRCDRAERLAAVTATPAESATELAALREVAEAARATALDYRHPLRSALAALDAAKGQR